MKAIAHREEDRTKAAVISVILHAILLALLFFITTTIETPEIESPPIVLEWGGGGDNARQGIPDAGVGPAETPAESAAVNDPAPSEPVSQPTPSNPSTTSPPKTATSADPNAAALAQAREEQRQRDLEAQRERDRVAAEKAAEEAKKNERKSQLGGAFNKDKPGGGSTPGTAGSPNGTGDNPFGKTPGSGGGDGGGDGTGTGVSIGGGLSGRKLVSRPTMADNTQKTGVVMVEVCVDASGRVISANYTLRNSTTNDSELRSKAVQWAKQHRFAASSKEKECGTFAFNFKLK
jgi:outer membrane biosynthesis protein TonB